MWRWSVLEPLFSPCGPNAGGGMMVLEGGERKGRDDAGGVGGRGEG